MEEIIYFELDNWFSGRDYPNVEPIKTWVENEQFSDDAWCKENKLCVMAGPIDMSLCWCIAAPRSWVEKNCPCMLNDGELEYTLINTSKDGQERKVHKYRATDFLCRPDEDGTVYGRVSEWEFPEYKEENFGVFWNNSYWDDAYANDCDDDDDEEETPKSDETNEENVEELGPKNIKRIDAIKQKILYMIYHLNT